MALNLYKELYGATSLYIVHILDNLAVSLFILLELLYSYLLINLFCCPCCPYTLLTCTDRLRLWEIYCRTHAQVLIYHLSCVYQGAKEGCIHMINAQLCVTVSDHRGDGHDNVRRHVTFFWKVPCISIFICQGTGILLCYCIRVQSEYHSEV